MRHLVDASIACLQCTNFVEPSECLKDHEVGEGRACEAFKDSRHKPLVKFGRVSGYDNPLVISCKTVDADIGKKRSCKGQFCDFWEYCGMPKRVLLLEV